MHSINITTIGKQKPGPEQELASRYLRQLKSFSKVEIRELSESKHARSGDIDRARSEDADSLRSARIPGAKHVLLTEHGITYSSEKFATALQDWTENETTTIQFLLAGPHGVSEDLEKDMDTTLSLSPLTFPHDIARALLLEQIYRAMTILKGKTYHY